MLPGSLLGSQALTWLEPRTVSRGVAILICFAWLLSFPSWGVMWRGYAVTHTGL
jgi:hypothetical protein